MDFSEPCAWLETAGDRIQIRGGMTIGRSRGSGLVLADDRVSRRHAVINAQDGPEYWLVDFGSSNGTYLNGRRVVKPMRLSDGDRIGISPFEIMFHCSASPNRRATRSDATTQMTVVETSTFTAWLLLVDVIG